MNVRCVFVSAFLLLSGCAPTLGQLGEVTTQPPVAIIGAADVQYGLTPDIRLQHLTPEEHVRVFSIRMFRVWQPANGVWAPAARPMIAWADVEADQFGTINLATADVRNGSWTGRNAYGLFWSGRRQSDPLAVVPEGFDFASLSEGEALIIVQRRDGTRISAPLGDVSYQLLCCSIRLGTVS